MKKTNGGFPLKNFAMALVAGLFTYTTVLANEPNDGRVTETKTFDVGMYRVVNSMKVNLLIEKEIGNSLEISLKNSNGEIIYVESLGKKMEKFAKKFDLSNLENGKYTFEIANGKEKIVKEIDVTSNQPINVVYRSIAIK